MKMNRESRRRESPTEAIENEGVIEAECDTIVLAAGVPF
jgi:hypothetical protein